MSRVLPPSPTRAEPRSRAETTTCSPAREALAPRDAGLSAPREDALSLDPLRATDRYRFALVYEERADRSTSTGALATVRSAQTV